MIALADYILKLNETLISHDYKKFINEIKTLFDNIDIEIIDSNSTNKSFNIVTQNNDTYEKIKQDKKFISLYKFYNYSVTYDDTPYNNEYVIYVEPNVTTDVTDYVYNECEGIVYHITFDANTYSIMHNGLRPKGKNTDNKDKHSKQYRNFSERVFCIAAPKDKVDDAIKEIAKSKGYRKRYATIKIDLSSLSNKIKFYRDTSYYDNDHAVYTFTYIPKEFLSLYK